MKGPFITEFVMNGPFITPRVTVRRNNLTKERHGRIITPDRSVV